MFFPDFSNIFPSIEIVIFGVVLVGAIFLSGAYAASKLSDNTRTGKFISMAIVILSIFSVLFGYAFALQTQSATNLEKAVTAWCNADVNSVKACNTVCYMIGGTYEITRVDKNE